MRSTAGEAKFTLYNEGPTCTITISDGSNKSRVLLNKKFNTKDYVGPITIPLDVTSIYCSSNLGKFKLFTVSKGKILYITYTSSGFSLDLSESQMQNYGSTAGDTLHISLFNKSTLTRKFTIKDGSKTLFGNVTINPKENRVFNVTNAVMGTTNIVVSNDLGQSIRLPIPHPGTINYTVSYKDTGFEYSWS